MTSLEEAPEAVVRPRRWQGPGLVWLVPLVAIAIAGWLVYTTIRDRGPRVSVTFESAEGLEPGKTTVRYKDVVVGTVAAVELAPDLQRIVVTLQMNRGTEVLLREGTAFWIVRPRVGAGGVTGLGTLLSGSYVELDPSREGAPRREFVGLEEPPLIRSTVPGTRYLLTAERLGGLSRGAPIYHRGIEVGQVLGYRLDPDGRGVTIPIFVRAPHDRLVGPATRFWDASGIALRTGPGGVELAVTSLQALLLGGVEFDGGPAADAAPAPPDSRFPLHPDRATAQAAGLTRRIPALVEFEGAARGLRPGAAVETRGIRIGTVTDVALARREEPPGLVVQARIELEPERVVPIDAETGLPDRPVSIEDLVASGERARLGIANLLTGELFVDLDVQPGAPPAAPRTVRGLPLVPSVRTEFEALSASLADILEKIAALPLDALVEELRTTARAVGEVARGEEMARTLETLSATLDSLRRTAAALEDQAPAALRALRQAAEQARDGAAAIESLLGADSRTRADLGAALREAAAAARALRAFAELLQRNPEALLRGRPGGSR